MTDLITALGGLKHCTGLLHVHIDPETHSDHRHVKMLGGGARPLTIELLCQVYSLVKSACLEASSLRASPPSPPHAA